MNLRAGAGKAIQFISKNVPAMFGYNKNKNTKKVQILNDLL